MEIPNPNEYRNICVMIDNNRYVIRAKDNMPIINYPYLYKINSCIKDEECINSYLDEDVSYAGLIGAEDENCTCSDKYCKICDIHFTNDDTIVHCLACDACHNIYEHYFCFKCKICHDIYDCTELLPCLSCTYLDKNDCKFNNKCISVITESGFKVNLVKMCNYVDTLPNKFIDRYLNLELQFDGDDDETKLTKLTKLYTKYKIPI